MPVAREGERKKEKSARSLSSNLMSGEDCKGSPVILKLRFIGEF